MAWIAIAALALIAWAWKKGRLRAPTPAEAIAILLGIAGAASAAKGKPIIGIPLLIGAAMMLNRARRIQDRALPAMSIEEARAVLDVPADADADTIRAEHRRLIRRVHPDAGGSAALTRRVNLARDTLLGAIEQRERYRR
ncbi:MULTISPECIES: molecular chaperone DnaJ [Edaphosphingomonas]|uniref:Molecular chaperone DnaJ n=2 Tax=Edaphosphingomonas TaxID=3423724 RepID=A0A2T4HZR7_9SPHN|nr:MULTISPECIES: molecular chaperone DnaJ [Sphingomonas]OHT18307.1 hypothetical protein BHE75_00278 [Sphingomonas haloaromaticamans]PTD21996.1 molecular chaperone DnaJ [Sphingomonas fennica]